MSDPSGEKRRYDSPVRREQAADTRARIVAAGAELLGGFPIWDWEALTVRAVAERAGVTERTVYRHFAGERDLREAVFAHVESESGVDIDHLALHDLRHTTAQMFAYVERFPRGAKKVRDPIVVAAGRRQRDAMARAVAAATDGWSEADRTLAAAMLDVLWSTVAYERLTTDWGLDADDAVTGITWVMGLVQDAIETGRPPSREG